MSPLGRRGYLIAAAFATLLPVTRSWAQSGDVAAGHRLADELCSRCHVVAPSGHGSWTDAPDFAAIANRPGMTAAQLSAFIQKPHIDMLNLQRPPREANDLAAYIMSLRGG